MRLTAIPSWATSPRQGGGSRPVNVCFVIDRLSRAGTETQLLALLNHLDRRLVRPSLCLLRGDGDPTCRASDDCPVLELGLTRLLRAPAIAASLRFASFLRRHRTDVVVTYFLDSTYFATPVARLCRIQHVIRVRNNSGYWLTPLHRRLGRVLGRMSHLTLTNSEEGRQCLIDERVAPERIHILENGVELDRFPDTTPPDTSGSVVRIGAVSNLRPVKNIDGLVRAATEVCRKYPQVRFDVAGDGDQRAAIEKQIRDAGLGDRFRLVGTLANIPAFLATLDVAVLCSHSESMSNALLEYMAAGRAIVATDVGANAKVVRDDVEGLIVAPRDDLALACAIGRLIDNPSLAKSLSKRARDRAATEFSRQKMVRRFEDFFVSLMND